MGKANQLKLNELIFAIGSRSPSVSLERRRLGVLPHGMERYRSIMPAFFHGKKLTTKENVTEKSKSRVKRVQTPAVICRFMYSRLLDMNVYCQMTTTTLRYMQWAGGFDEYVLRCGKKRLDNKHAEMYKRLVEEAFQKQKEELRKEELELLGKHGDAYTEF
ncbi:hypothetical protein HK101_011985 [Irineochytrium annulatum]|nr:hypothetical protein HK101_011985 [Irineochytrium annulatum]